MTWLDAASRSGYFLVSFCFVATGACLACPTQTLPYWILLQNHLWYFFINRKKEKNQQRSTFAFFCRLNSYLAHMEHAFNIYKDGEVDHYHPEYSVYLFCCRSNFTTCSLSTLDFYYTRVDTVFFSDNDWWFVPYMNNVPIMSVSVTPLFARA